MCCPPRASGNVQPTGRQKRGGCNPVDVRHFWKRLTSATNSRHFESWSRSSMVSRMEGGGLILDELLDGAAIVVRPAADDDVTDAEGPAQLHVDPVEPRLGAGDRRVGARLAMPIRAFDGDDERAIGEGAKLDCDRRCVGASIDVLRVTQAVGWHLQAQNGLD